VTDLNAAYEKPGHGRSLQDQTDAVIRTWTIDDWQAFLCRYLASQFNGNGQRPRASIPAQVDDDDFVLSRVVEHARNHLSEVKAK
jgi:hypothetical protein